jgi:hypothetical protein
MAKTPKTDEASEPLDNRITVMFSNSDITAIDDWRAEKRIWSRGDAIRQLVAAGLKVETQKD